MNRIVVGVDGSKGSQLALDWAANEARLRGAQLCVVHAWHPQYGTGYMFTPVVGPEVFENAARQVLNEMVDAIDTSDLAHPIEKRLAQCGAATALIGAGKDADLVVVGARGLGGFVGLLVGSVSQQVTHHAPCPVVVVPEFP
jgi:nucleotide-binding universal stress UspA family protein